MLPEYFEFSLPTRVVYGISILDRLDALVAPLGSRKAILVTDRVLAESGCANAVREAFRGTSIVIATTFDDVPPNSTIQTVEACAHEAVEHGCDLFLAVGGGSVIDTAKVANLLAVKGGSLHDHMGAYLLKPDEALHPSIIVPTTAGTGSEVTKVAVIADPTNAVKLPFSEHQFLPQLAILDPNLTVSMPPKLTAMTGMDALTHAIEAYVDREWSPASDALALRAVHLISNHILQACAHPDDLSARGAMLVGSFLAGAAFSHSMVGMTHGIAHALGGVYHIPHGLANALVLPEVMAYNLDACWERYADIAQAMGINFPQLIDQGRSLLSAASGLGHWFDRLNVAGQVKDALAQGGHRARGAASQALGNLSFIDGWVRKQTACAAIEHIRMLNRQLAFVTGMPLNLKDAGITDDLAKEQRVVRTAMEDGAMLYNPVEPSPEAVARILRKLFHSKTQPLPVSEDEVRAPLAARRKVEMTGVFRDTDMLYDVLVSFFEKLKRDPDIARELLKSDLCVQFVYRNPDGVITIDARGDALDIAHGAFSGDVEVTMTMNADFAHRFWCGKANLVTALTRRLVSAKGNVPKTLRLLPILKPAFEIYPKHLVEKGLGHLLGD